MIKVICFGEMLWDCFPDGKMPGGAPMNVALHLKQLGLNAKLVSKIGNDSSGEKLVRFMEGYQMPIGLIQIDSSVPTGQVIIDDTDKENIKYEIISPAAWDFITLSERLKKETQNAKALVFGSLSVRHKESWATLKQLVDYPLLKIFDINLRAPFIDFNKIEYLLKKTDILKINDDELQLLVKYFKIDLRNEIEEELFNYLSKNYSIQNVCITLGSKGAMMYQEGMFFHHSGYTIKVEDTVGAGDAFLSGFIKMYLKDNAPNEVLDFACKLGAFVAGKKGGTPKYNLADVESLKA